MSEEAVTQFFPFSSRVVKTLAPSTWERIFPPESASTCPTPVWRRFLGVVDVRWPVLALACVFGAVYGHYTSVGILDSPRTSVDRRESHEPGRFAWALVFRYYACMSACGLFYHCLLKEGSFVWGLAYAGDMAFTAASGLSIAIGGLVDMGCLSDEPVRAYHSALTCALVLTAVATYLLGWEAVPDQLYVQGIVLAGSVAGVLQMWQPAWLVAPALRRNVPWPPRRANRQLLLAGAIVVLAVPLGAEADRFLCVWLRSANASFITVGFWACNAGMVVLHSYYHAARGYRRERQAMRIGLTQSTNRHKIRASVNSHDD